LSVFCFIDEVTEVRKGESLTARFRLKGDEEFLKDHFDGFPVMPGVLLLETLKQAACRLLGGEYRLIGAENIKFGQFVKPGSLLEATVTVVKNSDAKHRFDGKLNLIENGSATKALTASFELIPLR
jgi:3-hydroxyacyl-[acyl-carrier-protein] dehydratase